MKYVVDTSAILAGSQYDFYEKKYFQTHWKNFDNLINNGTIVSTESVYKELIAKDDSMADWAKDKKYMFQKKLIMMFLKWEIIFQENFPIGIKKRNHF
ncbi:DUF4411 family protein [Methanobrevibacter arboriphilus]|uniref:DUF4411 family protein n=1 Tax=Methanobrevibacter arboriphilus TaxID=39441 RepID=UPI000A413C32|nr:DUF4411 family protein [Methanobrevibacter arboriphilus]